MAKYLIFLVLIFFKIKKTKKKKFRNLKLNSLIILFILKNILTFYGIDRKLIYNFF
jgi:hypothetical protein